MEIKRISDYYEEMYKLYPDVPKKDIQYILNYGWKSLYLHNSYGGDVIIDTPSLWCYFGTLRKNSLAHFKYYIRKLIIKLRVLYRKRDFSWDGYYYFALTNKQYEEYLNQINKRGRPRKYYKYGNHYLYKLLDECKVQEYNRKYIFRVPMYIEQGFKIYKENFTSGEAELIEIRDSSKFTDILISNNNYEILNGSKRSS